MKQKSIDQSCLFFRYDERWLAGVLDTVIFLAPINRFELARIENFSSLSSYIYIFNKGTWINFLMINRLVMIIIN